MDWIDSEQTTKQNKSSKSSKKSGKPRGVNLQKQLTATMSQPQDVWAAAFGHSLAGISWPKKCNVEATWLWSAVIMEQAEVLVRAGVSASKVAKCISGENGSDGSKLSDVSALMNEPLQKWCGQWLEEADAYPHAAIGVMATIWHLPQLANRDDSNWLTDWVESVSVRAAEYQQHQEDCLLSNLVFHCELPLLFGLLTATSRSAAQTNASKAMDDLAEYLENSQDHQGAWLAHGATYLRAALGCVFRSRVIADHLGLRKWYPPQKKSLSTLLSHAARWSRSDGTQLLAHGLPGSASQPIWNALCKQASTEKPVRHAMVLSGLLDGSRTEAKSTDDSRLPPATCNDEEASCTVMQRGWQHRGPRFAIDFSESTVLIEMLGSKGMPILRGPWSAAVELDGQAQMQLAGWEQLCCYSDDDVDYLEIEAKFGDSAKLQRQIVFMRDHRLMLLADALLCEQDGNWTMSSAIPLADGLQFEACGKNTEAKLVGNKAHTLAIPLYMPEWRSALATGSFGSEGNAIVVRNSCAGVRRVYSPVLLSLCNRHSKLPYTWRQLTVAEDLKIVSRDQAVAYRAQIGDEQYAFYRNLAMVRRRSFLGIHALCEFYAGSFDKASGEADTLVEVELNK